jgi:hypothetical protein
VKVKTRSKDRRIISCRMRRIQCSTSRDSAREGHDGSWAELGLEVKELAVTCASGEDRVG